MTAAKKQTCGGCRFARLSPEVVPGDPVPPSLNVRIKFEEALKLKAAIDEAVSRLNANHRGTLEGRRTALLLTVHMGQGGNRNEGSVAVLEDKLPVEMVRGTRRRPQPTP